MSIQQPRSRAQRLDPDKRKELILKTAANLYATHGSNFSTAELANQAKISEATIFRYFPDKPALLKATRDTLLDLDSLIPKLHACRDLPTLIQRLVAAGHALNIHLKKITPVLTAQNEIEPPDKNVITQLIAELTPLFVDHNISGVTDEQLAGVFLGSFLANTILRAKTGSAAIEVDKLIDLILHGISDPSCRRPGLPNRTTSI